MNLRLIVDSQRLLSAGLVPYAERIDPNLAAHWRARAETYSRIQRELRNIGGRLGNGTTAAGEAANAVSRLEPLRSDAVIEPRMLGGFQTLFRRIDSRITDILEAGVERGAFVQRVTVPPIAHSARPHDTSATRRFLRPAWICPTRRTRPYGEPPTPISARHHP